TMGVNVSHYKAVVFGISALYTGLAGALHGVIFEFVSPDSFRFELSIAILVGAVVGGIASLPGAVIGGLALGLLEAHSQWYLGPQLRDLIAYLLLFVLLAARVPWMTTRSAS
ncbi:MAG: ABC transporter permease subunit, partial [Burkholderiales bacterium]